MAYLITRDYCVDIGLEIWWDGDMDMTFEDALEAQMRELDDAYAALRVLHREPRVLNDECQQMKECQTRFRAISTRIFRLKLAWDESRDVMEQ